MNTKIKICGIRRPEDCTYINEALPDYAGFIFWRKSFRNVEPAEAAALRSLIDPKILCAGVFVDETIEKICEIVEAGTIQIVQLHGHEDENFIEELRSRLPDHFPVWKAFKVRSEADIRKALASTADRILLDNGTGTGECFDHSLIHHMDRPFILAGGLTPENIPELKERFAPAVLDISSGVETEKVKDHDKIIQAVRAARG